jgi:hypothetical protein
MAFTGPYPTKFSGHTDSMKISATVFSGSVTNAGTIGPGGGVIITSSTFLTGGFLNTNLISGTANGISVLSGSTIHGAIVDSGTIKAAGTGIQVSGGVVSGGIRVGSQGRISAGFSAIGVESAPTFGGGISNAGKLFSTSSTGIFVTSVAVFGNGSAGGITNTGTIAAGARGILVNPTTFFGGIKNQGIISAKTSGIGVNGGTFSGGITNSGTVFATSRGIALGVKPGFLFTGDLANAGKISAATGIGVGVATVRGAIVDSGTINATNKGILVDGGVVSGGIQVSSKGKIFGGSGVIVENTTTFAGGITNGGTISVATHAIIVTSLTAFAGGVTNSGKISIAGGSRQQYCECYWWCQQQRHYIGTQDRHSDRKCRAFRHWERGRWRQQQRRDHREDRHLDLEQHC